MHTHARTHTHTCTHRYTHAHTYTHMHTHIHTHTHTHTRTHIHTHIHTRTHKHTHACLFMLANLKYSLLNFQIVSHIYIQTNVWHLMIQLYESIAVLVRYWDKIGYQHLFSHRVPSGLICWSVAVLSDRSKYNNTKSTNTTTVIKYYTICKHNIFHLYQPGG